MAKSNPSATDHPTLHAGARLLKDERGASIIIALVFLLVCTMIAAVVVNFAGANAERSKQRVIDEQAYYDSKSALQLVQNAFDEDAGLALTMKAAGTGGFTTGKMGSADIGTWTRTWTQTIYEDYVNGKIGSYRASDSAQTFDIVVAGGVASSSTVKVQLTMAADYAVTAKLVEAPSDYSNNLEVVIQESSKAKTALDSSGKPVYPYIVTWAS